MRARRGVVLDTLFQQRSAELTELGVGPLVTDQQRSERGIILELGFSSSELCASNVLSELFSFVDRELLVPSALLDEIGVILGTWLCRGYLAARRYIKLFAARAGKSAVRLREVVPYVR